MEDEVVARTWNGGGLFAVLDGHNGRAAVEFTALHLPKYILDSVAFGNKNFEQAIQQGIHRTEKELLVTLKHDAATSVEDTSSSEDIDFPLLTSGVVVCLVLIEEGTIFTANVGDFRAVLSRCNSAVQLTNDHNIHDPVEMERVKPFISSEGFVRGLMVTRSLGNINVRSLEKCEGQIAEPSLSHFPICDSDEFLLVASDGLYEVINNDVAIATVHRAMKRPSFTPDHAAKELVERALARGSCDNICVCLIMLERPRYS
jgi:serine/threonine protein phosphatase PrpC